jgi:hypothetical protein
MSQPRLFPALALATILALPACGAGGGKARYDEALSGKTPQEKLPDQAPVFFPGEQLVYKLHIHGIEVGQTVLVAGQPGNIDGRKVLILKSRGETSGAAAWFARRQTEITSWVDLATGRPYKHHRDDRLRKKIITGDWSKPGNYTLYETPYEGKATVYKQTVPDGIKQFDMPSALLSMRAWKAKNGDRAVFYVLRNDMLWRTDMVRAKGKRIRVAAGNFDTYRIDGVTRRMNYKWGFDTRKPKRYFQMYITDDPQRIPVLVVAKTDWGDVKMELMRYRQGI